MQSLDVRRQHKTGAPFVDSFATLHHPQSLPASLLLSTPNPTPLQQHVYAGFAAAAGSGVPSLLDMRLQAWFTKLRAFADTHPLHSLQDASGDPVMKALKEEIATLSKEATSAIETQGIALQLFQCAPRLTVLVNPRLKCRASRCSSSSALCA